MVVYRVAGSTLKEEVMKKKTRYHSQWRVDQDYKDKLTQEDLEWLEKFNDEYYRSDFSDEPVHDLKAEAEYEVRFGDKIKGTCKQKLEYENNVRYRDIVTQYPKKILKVLEQHQNYTHRYQKEQVYSPSEYAIEDSECYEDELIEVIDSQLNKTA